MKPKFEVGDRVRMVRNYKYFEEWLNHLSCDEVYTVEKIDTDNKYVKLKEPNTILRFGVDGLELVEIADTKINRKLYPNAKITKRGLII